MPNDSELFQVVWEAEDSAYHLFPLLQEKAYLIDCTFFDEDHFPPSRTILQHKFLIIFYVLTCDFDPKILLHII